MGRIKIFLKDQGGATAIEYAIMASLIAAVVVISVGTMGGKVKGLFQTVADLFP